MIKVTILCGALLVVFPVLAQIDSNSVTVSSTRNTSLPADEVVFSLFVDTGMDAAVTEVIAALQSAGITAANLAGIGTVQNFNSDRLVNQLEWGFGLRVAIAKTKDTIGTLTALQQSIAQLNNGYTLSFQLEGSSVSQQSQLSQPCLFTDLVADARSQAQKLADASGLTLGAILGVSTYTSSTVGNTLLVGIYIGGFSNNFVSNIAPPCSMTVKFALTGGR